MDDRDSNPTDSSAAPPASPFEAAPRDLPAPRRGCSRMALAGCAVALVLIGLGVLTLMLKAGDIVDWSLRQVRVEIERMLPDDLPDADRQRLGRAFDAVSDRLESGELDAIAFQDLQKQLLIFSRLDHPPTPQEVEALATALELFAGIESPPGSHPAVEEPPEAGSPFAL